MTASLEPVAGLPDPATGELLPATPDNAADLWRKADTIIRRLQDWKALYVSVLVEESRVRGTKTLYFDGGVKVTLSYGPTTVYDPVELQENLRTVDCPEDRIGELVTETVSFKVNRSVLRQLAGANEDYRTAIELAGHEEERRPAMRVE